MSINYENAIARGWVEGCAKYADEEPHHGPYGCYVSMHDPDREKLLVAILDNGEKISAPICLVERWPRVSDDPAADYDAAATARTVRSYLRRDTGSGVEDVILPPGSDLVITADGWLDVEIVGSQWQAEYDDAEITREDRTAGVPVGKAPK